MENRRNSLKVEGVNLDKDNSLVISLGWFRLRTDVTEDPNHPIWNLKIGDKLNVEDLIFVIIDLSISKHSISIKAKSCINGDRYKDLRSINKLLNREVNIVDNKLKTFSIVERYINENKMTSTLGSTLSSDNLSDFEGYTGIFLSRKMKNLIYSLGCIVNNSSGVELEKMKFIQCDSIVPSEFSPFGKGDRSSCSIGYPTQKLKNIEEYKRYCDSLRGCGMNWNIFPIFDEHEDGHSLICIDKDERIHHYIPELDDNGCGSLLSNSQDEFVDKLYLG